MHQGRYVLAQLLDFIPQRSFHRWVQDLDADYKSQTLRSWPHLVCMIFAQLTWRESLRDIACCLNASPHALYHLGLPQRIAHSTLGYANAHRPWQVFAAVTQRLLTQLRHVLPADPLVEEVRRAVYILDSTTIDVCLSLMPWAPFEKSRGAVRLHTLVALQGSLPEFMVLTDGRVHDVEALDLIPVPPGSLLVLDRGYIDFKRLAALHARGIRFVVRARSNLRFRVIRSRPVADPIRCDQDIRLALPVTVRAYPHYLRRVHLCAHVVPSDMVLLTNAQDLTAGQVAELYRRRWEVEVFFRWIKQHLRIKAFFGTSRNAVLIQVWSALSTYLLVLLAKHHLAISQNLHTILQILSLHSLEKLPIRELFTQTNTKEPKTTSHNQLPLFT
jgi:Transposase DDE domain/Domain of unknown function (DUF4372)